MHPKRKQRLWVVLAIVVLSSTAIGLVAYALRGNINLFYPPVEVVAGSAPVDRPIRVGGMVVEGSVVRSETDLNTRFDVTDYEGTVTVSYTGILPDLFSEGEGVVASGTLDASGLFTATEVLAKHDENYMPPEVAAALEGKSAPSKDAPSYGGEGSY
ncbi:ABC superfamily (atp_bind), heme exporter protein, Cytochrome c-type biogenesis protein [Luminiphilus syltensis NOR5-1B]|uniref:Cytochrome c-type biogenesis protein CcmE n=1 Tax=Luminiphilus syltensis NOR5-1B TaxID=565045 RepID=B8KS78_9GAMM|nr:cytochrome c maturation protein CcmE [Luminiphilus syltensis]EED34189.1 ABC superfamily (atp_bind), heme exporter protein, Cytochrome c-type biogenesis protein [Luminiphilus syltensis NOR5-1B]